MILGVNRISKSGPSKREGSAVFLRGLWKPEKQKNMLWVPFFVGIAASSCWAGKWNRFVIVLAEQPSLISHWDLWDLHKYLTVSKEMLTKPPHRISKEFNKKRKKKKPPQNPHTYRNCHLNISKSVIHRCQHRLICVQAIAGTKNMAPDVVCWGELS